MKGPGKYDAECEYLLVDVDAEAALVIVLGGRRGSGFSFSERADVMHKLLQLVPDILRQVAAEIEADIPGQTVQ